MNVKSLCAIVALTLTASAWAADPAVKKSDNGICHDSSSPSYGNTKKFTPFDNIDACLKSGGKLPAGQKAPAAAAPVADPVKKSDSGICHDKTSPNYAQLKNFTPFDSMDACVKSGGKPPKK